MSEILKIRLRPLSKFLFGREKTKGRTDYFLRSHLFPQQTAVLGLLRYEILRRNDLLSFKGINDANEAAKHIGESSFSGTATQTFGEIEQVSPIELVCGQEVFNLSKNFIKPKAKTDYKILEGLKIHFSNQLERTESGVLTEYDPKNENDEFVSNQKKLPVYCEEKPYFKKIEEGVFGTELHIGITKNYKGQSERENESFYKMEFLRLHPDCCYQFYVRMKDTKWLMPFETTVVNFGAERSPFEMQIEKSDFNFAETKNEPKIHGKRLVLLSDAYVENAIFKHCNFAATDITNFRNLKTETTNNKSFNKKPVGEGFENPLRTLLKRGSVLYPSDWTEVLKHLNNLIFRTIGYNFYTIEP